MHDMVVALAASYSETGTHEKVKATVCGHNSHNISLWATSTSGSWVTSSLDITGSPPIYA